jgi:hypothetical protein
MNYPFLNVCIKTSTLSVCLDVPQHAQIAHRGHTAPHVRVYAERRNVTPLLLGDHILDDEKAFPRHVRNRASPVTVASRRIGVNQNLLEQSIISSRHVINGAHLVDTRVSNALDT